MTSNQPSEARFDSIAFDARDRVVEKLNQLLHLLHNRISILENAEVDWDNEDDSNFIIVNQYKTEVCLINEKINRITGNTTTAFVAEPIQFNGTQFTEFNRRIEKMVNDKRKFPNAFDVLECIKICNQNYNYRLTEEDCFELGNSFYIILVKSI